MDLQEILDFLGGSLLADDYRGFLEGKAAELELESNDTGTASQNTSTSPRHLLKRAIFSMVSGNHAKARYWLQHIGIYTAGRDLRWESRIKCYGMLNFVLRCHPAAIRFWSRKGSSGALIFETQNLEMLSELSSWPARHDGIDQLEQSLPLRLYQYNIFLWAMQCLHPNFARPELAMVASQMTPNIGGPFPPGYIESAIRLKLTGLTNALKRMKLDAEISRDPLGQDRSYEEIVQHMQDTDDLVGQALLSIRKADSLYSPSFTSPLALNLMVDGKLSGTVDLVWDLEEPRFPLIFKSAAERHYQDALFLMEAAGCRRGRGAILLRQAAVIHAEVLRCALSRESSDDRKPAADIVKQLSEASTKLENALEDFRGDESNTNLVMCHQILLDISRSHLEPGTNVDGPSFESRAGSIGEWGKGADNPMLAQFCGLLMLRFGRRMLLDYDYLDIAVLCTSCAKALFQELGDKTFYLSSLMTRADLIHSSGNYAEAQLALEDAQTYLTEALTSLKQLGGKDDRLDGPIANLLLTFDSLASRILMSAANPQALRSWREKYAELEIDVEQFLRSSHLTAVGGTNHPSADASGIMNEQRRVQALGQLYNTMYDEAYAQLESGNIDGYEARFFEFLASTRNMDVPTDQLATFRIIANSALGLTREAAQSLPEAVPLLFDQQGTSMIDLMLSQVSFQGQHVELLSQIIRQQGERGFSLCFLSQSWSAGRRLLDSIAAKAPGFLILNDPTARGISWMLDSHIGAVFEHNNDLDIALQWYLRAMHSMETHRDRNADATGRGGSQTSIHGSELFSGLIRVSLAYAEASNVRPPSAWGLTGVTWTEQALIFAEHASARTLLEFIMSHSELAGTESGDIINMQEVARYTFLKRQIADLSTAPVDDMLGKQGQPQEKAKALIEAREKAWEAEKFSLQLELEKLENEKGVVEKLSKSTQAMLRASRFCISLQHLFSAIPEDAVVIEINMSRSGIVVFGITRNGIQHVYRSGTTIIQMRRYILRYLNDISTYERYVSTEGSRTHTISNLAAVLSPDDINSKAARISNEIVMPFDKIIAKKEHVIFVPSDAFNVFPFSAMIYAGQPIFLSKAVSQVPSLATLQQLTARPRRAGKTPLSTIFDNHAPPRPQPRAPLPSMNTTLALSDHVPGVGVSALLTSSYFGSAPRHAATVSESAFRVAYQESDIVLLSTHGIRSPCSPWQSYIKLAQDFRVMEVSQYRTQAALVVFGACLSGTGRVTAANDVYGFSHAVLQSGARAYMGALWKVSDYVTMLLLVSFFRLLATPVNNRSLARCFQQAQQIVYGLDIATAVAMLKEMSSELSKLDFRGMETEDLKKLEETKVTSLKYLKRMVKDVSDGIVNPNFKHPYCWAAFGLVGYGGLHLH